MQLRDQSATRRLDVEFDTRLVAALGAEIPYSELSDRITRRAVYLEAFRQFFESFDLWLTPTISAPAPRIGQQHTPALSRLVSELFINLGMAKYLRKSDQFEAAVIRNLTWTPFTQIANYLGLPSMSVPLFWTQGGLPLGVQFVGSRGTELRLLSLASDLEQARPWFNRRPSIAAEPANVLGDRP
jgi:amidase